MSSLGFALALSCFCIKHVRIKKNLKRNGVLKPRGTVRREFLRGEEGAAPPTPGSPESLITSARHGALFGLAASCATGGQVRG